MRISVHLTPWTKQNSVERTIDLLWNEVYLVRIKARPIEGKANKMLLEVIAEYFWVPRRKVSLKKWLKSRNKILEISS